MVRSCESCGGGQAGREAIFIFLKLTKDFVKL